MSFKSFFFFLILAAIVWQVLIFAPLETGEVEQKTGQQQGQRVQDAAKAPQWMQGIHLVESKEGTRDWELRAKRAQANKAGDTWKLDAVRVQFYSKGKKSMTVRGEKGVINIETKDMTIEGNVRTVSQNGYIFESPSLIYNSGKRTLKTADDVRMLGPMSGKQRNFTLSGKSLLAHLESGEIHVHKNVKTKMRRREQYFDVKSDSANFSSNSKKADFKGNVVIDVDTLRVTGPRARFVYSKSSDDLKSAIVNGGIRVSDLDKWATSDTVDIEFDSDKFVFRGKPKLVQNNDELIGEVITFLKGGKMVKVDRARARVDKEDLGDRE